MEPSAASPTSPLDTEVAVQNDSDGDLLVDDELLVEEISIDGMCGVY